MADLKYPKKIEKVAERVGFWIAKNQAVLIFGAEKDSDSLSGAACRGAKKAGGLAIGVTYGKGLKIFEQQADVVIASGLERGGGREFPLVLSCDVVIAISGGSGTLNEICVAYQAGIPVVAIKNSGGWSEKLIGTFLDNRKREKIYEATNSLSAVKKALELANGAVNKLVLPVFLTGVHGDEKVGQKVLNSLQKEGKNFSWLLGNKKAFIKNQRFVEGDLNRLAPGNIKSKVYEERLAARLLKKLILYDYVIDIHETVSASGIFTIVTNPTRENLLLAGCLPIQNIVIWQSGLNSGTGPLMNFVKCGVEIECGPKGLNQMEINLKKVIEKILEDGINFENSGFGNKQIFKVYGKLQNNQAIKPIDFKLTKICGEEFYPLLVGQYPNIICYKMKKINKNLWKF